MVRQLRRALERMGIEELFDAGVLKHPYESDTDRYEAWMYESLLYGLRDNDGRVKARCWAQASLYRGHFEGRGGAVPGWCGDAFSELRNQVEGSIPR